MAYCLVEQSIATISGTMSISHYNQRTRQWFWAYQYMILSACLLISISFIAPLRMHHPAYNDNRCPIGHRLQDEKDQGWIAPEILFLLLRCMHSYAMWLVVHAVPSRIIHILVIDIWIEAFAYARIKGV